MTFAIFIRRASTPSAMNSSKAAISSIHHTRWRDSISSLLNFSFAAAAETAFGSAPVTAAANSSTLSRVKSDSLLSTLTAAKSELLA